MLESMEAFSKISVKHTLRVHLTLILTSVSNLSNTYKIKNF